MSVLWETVKAAMQQRRDQLAAGATLEEAAWNLEQSIRACWPFTREWHYLCGVCDDSGWRRRSCNGERDCGCLRRFLVHAPHDYAEPCHCAAGHGHRPASASEVPMSKIGKVERKWTRAGQ